MKSFIKWCFVYLSLLTGLVIIGSSPAIAKVDCEKRPDHPACADSDDGTVQLGPGDFWDFSRWFDYFGNRFVGNKYVGGWSGDFEVLILIWRWNGYNVPQSHGE